MREHFEAVNHKQCVERIERFVQKKETLTTGFILELHRIILHGIDNENAGRFRSNARTPNELPRSKLRGIQPQRLDVLFLEAGIISK